MKCFKITITQDVYIDIDSDAATEEHAKYLARERARLFCAEGKTNTLGGWFARGGFVEVAAIERLTDTGWPVNKKPAQEEPAE